MRGMWQKKEGFAPLAEGPSLGVGLQLLAPARTHASAVNGR